MFKIFSKNLIYVYLSPLFFSGCASIFGDNSRNVVIKSRPSDAEVYIDNIKYGKTPIIATLPNYIYSGKIITIKKDGYVTSSSVINNKFQPVGLWNILFWPGFIIDAATGNMVKINPINLNIDMDLELEQKVEAKNK